MEKVPSNNLSVNEIFNNLTLTLLKMRHRARFEKPEDVLLQINLFEDMVRCYANKLDIDQYSLRSLVFAQADQVALVVENIDKD